MKGKFKVPRKRRSKRQRRSKRRTRKLDRGLSKMSKLVFKPINHVPMPQIFMTTITASAAGYITAGAVAFQQSFPANWTYRPFGSAPAVGAITWFQIIPGTYNPPGHNFFLNNSLYARAICYASKFEFDLMQENAADIADVAITPAIGVGVPSTYGSAATAAFTKQYMIGAARTATTRGEFPIKYYMQMHDFLGVNKIVYNSDTGIYDYISNSPPNRTVYWSLNVQSADNANWANAVPIKVRITYFVKFYDLSQASFSA